MPLKLVPITLRAAGAFVQEVHRHNKPPRGHKFSIGLESNGNLVGVGMAGRPVARLLDDGQTLEVNRTCTDGTTNANSMLYGAVWRAAQAMGYIRCITYKRADESGASLRGAGWRLDAVLPARKGWADSTADERLVKMRDADGDGGVDRERWIVGEGWPDDEE